MTTTTKRGGNNSATRTRPKAKAVAAGVKGKAVKEKKEDGQRKMRPVKVRQVTLRLQSMSAYIQHQWPEKAKEMMRQKHLGKKTKTREVRDPKAEGQEAAYRTSSGEYGIPVCQIKASMINASHKDLGIEKTLVRKALFIECDDVSGVIPMECSEPVIHEDPVRVGQGSADLRYRPYFYEWGLVLTCTIDGELLTVEDLLALFDRAGFGVGIGEWRPEKGGEHGRFRCDPSFPVEVKEI